jgi:hypothetical protein
MDTEFSRRVGCRGDHAALGRFPAHDHGLAFERWIEQFFHRYEEGVHVEVEE